MSSVEGLKEIELALLAGLQFDSLFFVEGLADEFLLNEISKTHRDIDFFSISEELFSKVSYRESTGGMIAIVKTRMKRPEDLNLSDNPLILIIEGVEKPGNLGAMLRTADAAAIDAVICCNLPGDVFNPNIIRASLGTVFTVPLAVADNKSVMEWLKKNRIRTFCSDLHQSNDYFAEDYTGPSAIVVGTEATGVSNEWIEFSDVKVKVPMLGKIDSMNVSVAAAIMLYEARRQRLYAV